MIAMAWCENPNRINKQLKNIPECLIAPDIAVTASVCAWRRRRLQTHCGESPESGLIFQVAYN
jgi:hypothetical protein